MKEHFGAKDPKSWKLRFHTQTGGSTLTAQQPDNNIVRVTLQALAAVMGGTQSLHTNSRDEALALPTEESARIALRTQQIIANESGVADTIDPLAGSYYVEALTDQIEKEANVYLDRIREIGGAVQAVEEGYMQREIHQAAYEAQKRIESKEDIVVGMNEFRIEEEIHADLLRVDEALEKAQVKKTRQVREERDSEEVAACLDALHTAAKGSENVMPHIVKAVKAYATVGEIANVLREEYGEYTGM